MIKYYFLEIIQTQAFDMIIGVSCIIPFYFLMKFYVSDSFKKQNHKIKDLQDSLNEIMKHYEYR